MVSQLISDNIGIYIKFLFMYRAKTILEKSISKNLFNISFIANKIVFLYFNNHNIVSSRLK